MNKVHECVGREHATSNLEREEVCMAELDGEHPACTVRGSQSRAQERRCGVAVAAEEGTARATVVGVWARGVSRTVGRDGRPFQASSPLVRPWMTASSQ